MLVILIVKMYGLVVAGLLDIASLLIADFCSNPMDLECKSLTAQLLEFGKKRKVSSRKARKSKH
jgi:hypothetical protein